MAMPLEVKLRPPVEAYSGSIAIGAGLVAAKAPSLFMMSTQVAYASAAVLVGFGCYRLMQGWEVLRYQRNLRRLPKFELKPGKVPVTNSALFIGKGFRWTQKHTQRLKSTVDPRTHKYLERGPMYKWARNLERDRPDNPLAKLTKIDSALNPFRSDPDIGGNRVVHAVELKEEKVWLRQSDREGHMLFLGTTGCGKSTAAGSLVCQDIARGDGAVVVIDPKGDKDLLINMYSEAVRQGREKDFIFFHLGFPKSSSRYNAIGSFSRISEVASRLSSQLSNSGDSQVFADFAWRFLNVAARAMVFLGERPDYAKLTVYIENMEGLFRRYAEAYLAANPPSSTWQADVQAFEIEASTAKKNPRSPKFSNPKTEALLRYIETAEVRDPVLQGLMSAIKYDSTYYAKITASLLPLLEKLQTGHLAELISPDYFAVDDPRTVFDWLGVIREKKIVYVGLDALTDGLVASVVGNSMFNDLSSLSGVLYKHGAEYGVIDGNTEKKSQLYLHLDEFSQVAGDELVKMLAMSRGSGYRITAYSQSKFDIEDRLGSTAAARRVEANFSNLVMMRVKDRETAELLCNQLPEVEVNNVMTVSSASDSSDITNNIDFSSSTQDRISQTMVPMIEPSTIMSLPKGQAMCLINGSQLYKVRFPIIRGDEDCLPETMKRIVKQMAKQYYSADEWWVHQ